MGYIQVTRKNFRGPHRDPIAVEVQESAGYDGLTLHTCAGDAVNRNGRSPLDILHMRNIN